MVGFPKYLNTKQDYLYVKNNFTKDNWYSVFQELLDTEKGWLMTSKLADNDTGITDDTHKIIENKDETGTVAKERYQYEYKVDPNCKMLRLGFTEDEIKDILS